MWAATQGDLTLIVDYDSDPMNPRTDWDNFGKMVCWHRRYDLGDEHSHDDPEDFLHDTVREMYADRPQRIVEAAKKGRLNGARMQYDRSRREWVLCTKAWWKKDSDWYEAESFPPKTKGSGFSAEVFDCITEEMSFSDMYALLDAVRGFIMMPLYLYDHSGITMSTGKFSCPWDSGRVGWIYATPEMIQAEYGDISKASVIKARALLEAEVKYYDLYLTGQCYGYRCFESKNETDSSWGVLGNFDDFIKSLPGKLGEEFRPLVAELEFQHHATIGDYFWATCA